MRSGRLILATLVVLVTTLSLALGCAAPTATPTPTPTLIATPTPTPSFPLAIHDSDGKPVTLLKPPQRIVVLDSASVEILFAMGEGDRVVGIHDFVLYPPEATQLPKVGDAFNLKVEKVAELEPDLIYTMFALKSPQLEALGIPVLYLKSPTTLAQIPERMRLWGRITGKTEAAENLAVHTEQALAALRDKLGPIEKGPRVFHDLGDFWTTGPDTFQGDIYQFLKAQNIAHDVSGFAQMSVEVVVERDPEVAIASFGAQAYQDNPALAGISAVKNNRVHSLDVSLTTLISVEGPRIVQGLEEMAKLLYPGLFP